MLVNARRYIIDGGIEPLYVPLPWIFAADTQKGNNFCSINSNPTDVTQGPPESHHGHHEEAADGLCRTLSQTLILYF